jgi:hypothetical protein
VILVVDLLGKIVETIMNGRVEAIMNSEVTGLLCVICL